MSTLTELNSYSNNTVTFTDNRPSEVVFDYPTSRNISKTLTGTTFTLETLINIIDIIKASEANVTFEVDVSNVPGATVTWGTLPSGVTSQQVGSVYKLLGISSASDWEDIKEPTLTAPVDFQGNFIYNCTISYTQAGERKTQTWQVGNFIPLGLLTTNILLTAQAKRYRSTAIDLLVDTSITPVLKDVALAVSTTLTVQFEALNRTSAALSSDTTLSLYQPVQYINSINYLRNRGNLLWNENTTPILQDRTPTGATFEFIVQVNGNSVLSKDGGTTTSTSVSWSGTLTSINNSLSSLILYPNYNTSSTIILTYTFKKNGSVIETSYINLTASGTGLITPYTLQLNTGNYYPTYEQLQYGQVDLFLVGSGGGGGYASSLSKGGGGGGGGAILLRNQTINYRINGQTTGGGTASSTATGGNGGNTTVTLYNSGGSTVLTQIATGGTGGGAVGGNSGYPTTANSTVNDWNYVTQIPNTTIWVTRSNRLDGTGAAGGSANVVTQSYDFVRLDSGIINTNSPDGFGQFRFGAGGGAGVTTGGIQVQSLYGNAKGADAQFNTDATNPYPYSGNGGGGAILDGATKRLASDGAEGTIWINIYGK
jgi:hypothetical protein